MAGFWSVFLPQQIKIAPHSYNNKMKVTVKLRRNYDVVKNKTIKQFPGSNTGFQGLTITKNGLTHGMTHEQQTEMEELLHYPKGHLRPVQARSGENPMFWDMYSVKLPTEGLMILDLDVPEDKLKYYYLKSKGKKVACSLAELELKPDAEIVLVEEGSEEKAKVTISRSRKKARKQTDNFSTTEMQTLLMVYGETTGQTLDPRSMSPDALEAKVDELVEANPDLVLSILEHPEYKQHGKVAELYLAGVIEKRNDAYFSTEGAMLGTDLEDMVVFLKDKARSVEVANLYKKIKR